MEEHKEDEIENLLTDLKKRVLFMLDVEISTDEDGDVKANVISDSINLYFGWYGDDDYEGVKECLDEMDDIWNDILKEGKGEGVYSIFFLFNQVSDGDGYRNWTYLEYVTHRIEYYLTKENYDKQQENLIEIGGFNFFEI